MTDDTSPSAELHAVATAQMQALPQPQLQPRLMPGPSASLQALPSGLPVLVDFKNVTKVFGTGANAKVALQDISFTIFDIPKKGELVTIVGPSGCGKSTLMRIIAGLRPHWPHTAGDVAIFGNGIIGAGSDRGLVDQKYSLLSHLNVIDNIAFGLMLKGVSKSERRDKAREWVGKVGLEGSEYKYVHELSGGMQQRVAIAATLILGPRIILMDEPFGALDPRIRLRMQELLIKLWQEQESTIFFITHSVEEAVYLGDTVFRMAANPGRLVEVLDVPRPSGSPEVTRHKPWFLESVREILRRLEGELPAGGPIYAHRTV